MCTKLGECLQKVKSINHLKVDLLQYSPVTEWYVAIKKKEIGKH